MDVKPQTDPPVPSPTASASATTARSVQSDKVEADNPDSLLGFASFLAKVVLAFLILRSFVVAPFSIPSDSMLPSLWQGDYVIASKWPYGYSRYSLPFNAPLFTGRVFASAPQRGDIVFFKHPIDQDDYVKRVIGVPGDTVSLRDGQVILNGAVLPQQRKADFAVPLSSITECPSAKWDTVGATGEVQCRFERASETLPSGRRNDVLNVTTIPLDTIAPVTVPEGAVFVMGDHRDKSSDSRSPAQPGLGVGLVPQVYLVGRAEFIIWSTDGSAQWIKPWTWFTAARWDRIGSAL
ncbi:MAG: signal peptidase I [Pseudomonadota bacterium]